MGKFKDVFIYMRNALALVFSWLVLLTVIYGLISGMRIVPIAFLARVFILSLWGVISFSISFKVPRIRKKGFMIQLTCFYLMFIPVEIVMFYLMGLFNTGGSVLTWCIFGGLVAAFYLISLFIDLIVMRKRAELYTKKMEEYVKGNEV